MDRDKKLDQTNIEKVLMENFVKLMPSFYEMQSSFLSGIYKRYGDLEGGNIVIFFARDLHLEILRMSERDLNFNLSLEEGTYSLKYSSFFGTIYPSILYLSKNFLKFFII